MAYSCSFAPKREPASLAPGCRSLWVRERAYLCVLLCVAWVKARLAKILAQLPAGAGSCFLYFASHLPFPSPSNQNCCRLLGTHRNFNVSLVPAKNRKKYTSIWLYSIQRGGRGAGGAENLLLEGCTQFHFHFHCPARMRGVGGNAQ